MKSFNLWMIEKDGDAHETMHGLTMQQLTEALGVSRQAIYDSLNKGVLIKGIYTVHYEEEGDILLDYFDGKAYNFAIYDKNTDTIYPDFLGGVLLTKQALAIYSEVLHAPIEIISDEVQSYIVVDTANCKMLRHLMEVLNGLTSDKGLYINIELNEKTRIIELSPHKVVTENTITGEIITVKTAYALVTLD